MTKYPIGATWEGKETSNVNIAGEICNHHRTAIIWLDRIEQGIEFWYVQWLWEDGNHGDTEWNTSYQGCKNWLPFNCRMRRIK